MLMKLKFILLILLVQSYSILCSGQDQKDLKNEEGFRSLKEFMSKNLQADFLDKSDNKYSSYYCKVMLGEKNLLSFSEGTPKFVKEKEAQLEKRLFDFMTKEGISFKEEVVIVYPVIQIWKDKKARVENLEEMLNSLFGEGLNLTDKSDQVRIESPIVISALGVVN